MLLLFVLPIFQNSIWTPEGNRSQFQGSTIHFSNFNLQFGCRLAVAANCCFVHLPVPPWLIELKKFFLLCWMKNSPFFSSDLIQLIEQIPENTLIQVAGLKYPTRIFINIKGVEILRTKMMIVLLTYDRNLWGTLQTELQTCCKPTSFRILDIDSCNATDSRRMQSKESTE